MYRIFDSTETYVQWLKRSVVLSNASCTKFFINAHFSVTTHFLWLNEILDMSAYSTKQFPFQNTISDEITCGWWHDNFSHTNIHTHTHTHTYSSTRMHTLSLISFMTPEITSTMTRAAGEMPSEDTQQKRVLLLGTAPAPWGFLHSRRQGRLAPPLHKVSSYQPWEALVCTKLNGHHNIYLKASKKI